MPTPYRDGFIFDDQFVEEFVHEVRQTPSQEAFVSEYGINQIAGLSAHRAHDQLVHRVAEDSHHEIIRSGGKVTGEIWWTDVGKTIKIREVNYTRSEGKVTVEEWKQYDDLSVLLETLTITYTRQAGKVVSEELVLS
jgi:hypothetical protein